MPDFWKDSMPNIVTLEEVEALRHVYEVAELYGWRIPVVWTPALVKHMFYIQYNRQMTDQEWDIFASGNVWNNELIMAGAEAENEIVLMAFQDAIEDSYQAHIFAQLVETYGGNENV